MSHPHEHEPQAAPQGAPAPRTTFAAPRLDLPRFQFRPTPLTAAAGHPPTPTPTPTNTHTYSHAPTHAPAPTHHAPAPAPAHPQPAWTAARPAAKPMLAQTLRPATTAAPSPAHPAAPAPTWQSTAPAAAAPLAVATAPAPAPRHAPTPAATAMANATSQASTISWNSFEPVAERGLLQRISPVHMGVLMVLVMMMLVMTSGPAAMTAKPARLPAVVDGGGSATGVPTPARAGATAVAAAGNAAGTPPATPAAAKAPATKAAAAPRVRRAKMLKVGSAQVRARVRAGGIPSPAAAANLAIAGGGRVSASQTGSVRMSGIPSPAASRELGPQVLPFRPSDGVTLPRAAGERDSHAIDTHYGATTLAMEEPVAMAMTPGAAAAQAERHVTMQQLSNGTATPPSNVAGGASWAF